MSRVVWSSLWLTPLLLGTAVFSANAQVSPQAGASTDTAILNQVATYGAEGRGAEMGQVTSISQFTDVRPTDWAYQALQSLVERYGCIVGYPDKTYRGNRALTRYEFAAGLNACLDKIQELIAAATADFVKKEDLEVVKRLQEEFSAELAALRGRVESLEVRTATLEKQQFSTTTKLTGEVVFSLADTFGDAAAVRGNDSLIDANPNLAGIQPVNEDDNTETIFANRVRLGFNTSFSGRDLLLVRMQARNITPFSGATLTGTNGTRLGADGSEGNSVLLDKVLYRFPVGKNVRIQIDAANAELYDSALFDTLSPFTSSSQGSISRFGRMSPIFRANNPSASGSAAASFDWKLSPNLSLQGGYFSDQSSNDPGIKNGLFNGAYAAVGQLVFRPSKAFDIGLTYAHSYSPGASTTLNQGAPNITSSTGTAYASNPFNNDATSFDQFSAQLQWRLSKAVTFGGWYGYGFAGNRRTTEEARIANWAAFLAFPDLGRKGNLGGLLFGMTPRVVDNDYRNRFTTGPNRGLPNPNSRRRLDEDPPFHFEAFYRYRVNDNISVTPGVFVLFNPEGNSQNSTQVVGVVRTTFTF